MLSLILAEEGIQVMMEETTKAEVKDLSYTGKVNIKKGYSMLNKVNHHKSCMESTVNGIEIFSQLDPEEILEVEKYKVANYYKKGQTLFLQGNPVHGLYCISSGKVKIIKIGPNGKETLIQIASSGELVGHESLHTEEFYSNSAIILESSTIFFFDKKYILKTLQDKPSVAMKYIHQLGLDLRNVENRMYSMFQKNVRERLAELLLLLSDSYGVAEGNGRVRLDLELTREEMGSMIGTAYETLIRFLSEFKEDGLIEQVGRTMYIVKEKDLLELANA